MDDYPSQVCLTWGHPKNKPPVPIKIHVTLKCACQGFYNCEILNFWACQSGWVVAGGSSTYWMLSKLKQGCWDFPRLVAQIVPDMSVISSDIWKMSGKEGQSDQVQLKSNKIAFMDAVSYHSLNCQSFTGQNVWRDLNKFLENWDFSWDQLLSVNFGH